MKTLTRKKNFAVMSTSLVMIVVNLSLSCVMMFGVVSAFRSSPPISSTSTSVPVSTHRRPKAKANSPFLLKAKSDLNEESDENNSNQDFPSSSSEPRTSGSNMNDYISQFLSKNTPPPPSLEEMAVDKTLLEEAQLADIGDATHLIAIPMEQSHELMIELESVQRAILYHCPILLDACISAASTRLPLLYVQATNTEGSSGRITTALGNLVDRLVKKHIFRAEADPTDQSLNAEGYRPVTMTFQSLEIEGDNNSILSTIGTLENDAADDKTIPQSSTSLTRFSNFIQDLQSAVAAQGWKMAFPPDPNHEKTSDSLFRPRISFMELPVEFDENLSRYKSTEEKITEEEMEFLSSAQGGNGISPIFWCQWWDDVFARNVRMREIGIYTRSPMQGVMARNSQFLSPMETIPLPDGSPSMLQSERKFQEYQEQRLEEEQDLVYQANQDNNEDGFVPPKTKFVSNSTASKNSTDPDLMITKTRKRLERIFLESATEKGIELEEENGQDDAIAQQGNVLTPSPQALTEDDDEEDANVDLNKPNHPIEPKEDDYMDDWMKERIEKAVNSLESVKVRSPVKKEMPPIIDNPVFKAYKEGTLVPKDERIKKKTKNLGPYPGNDHFVGIWRVVASPTGFDVDDTDETKIENLILRVDGTTAGGPTLNEETRQKAAGGTWKMIPQDDGDVLLRIRLVIPPEKQRILVMEGLVQRIGSKSGIPTASRTFGIPEVEERAKKSSMEQMQLMTCSGKVHIEDAITKKNRELIGDFSLMKLQGPKDKNEYTITIPKPVQNIE